MIMFWNRKRQAPCRQTDNSRRIVHDFRLRCSRLFESYRCVDYQFYAGLEEKRMLPLLDAHLERMLSGEVDDGNGDMLIGLILSPTREAMADYEHQRAGHQDTIYRLAARDAGDRDCIEGYYKLSLKELADLEAEHAKTLRLIEQWKENG